MYIVITVCVSISPTVPQISLNAIFPSFSIEYSPSNIFGINTNEASSATAILMYMSVILYGASIYRIDDNSETFLFLVTFIINVYIVIPDNNVTANINIFKQFVNVKLNILNINGAYAVNGL